MYLALGALPQSQVTIKMRLYYVQPIQAASSRTPTSGARR